MKLILYIMLINFSVTNFLLCTTDNRAIVIVPVADLVGEPIKSFGLAKTVKESYDSIAICGGPNHSSLGAPRIHQALFNEEVEIVSLEEGKNGDDGEACIKLHSSYFITAGTHKPQNLYWTRTKNLLSLNKLRKRGLSLDHIPPTPSFKNPCQHNEKNLIALIKPFHDTVTGQTFSAGTRFIFDSTESTQTHYAAHIFDRFFTTFRTSMVPKDGAHELDNKNHKEMIECFVELLKQWSHCMHGNIVYVWGGSSYTGSTVYPFKQSFKTLSSGKKIIVFERSDQKNPCVGFDCAGIILRAAQICGIPYFYKNTYTLAHYLKSVAVDEHLHEGDLIWIPGHVMIVSDIAHNKLIEARGYSHDYGVVHEISLEKVFKGIKTYNQLVHAFHTQHPLIRYNKAGQEVEEINKFKLLKLESVWQHPI